MRTTLRYLVLTALRDRLFAAMLTGIAVIALLGAFLGDKSVVEGQEATAAFVAFATRLLVICGMVLFVAIHVRRGFESREMLLILSRPISRGRVVLAYWAGFSAIALLLVAPAVLALALVGAPAADGLALWGLSLALESMLLIAFALFFAFGVSGVVAAALGCLGFYVLARMIGVLNAIRSSEFRDGSLTFAPAVDRAIDVLAMLVPRLDLFGQSRWLVHGIDRPELVPVLLGQAAVYTALIVTAAIFDFQRRRF